MNGSLLDELNLDDEDSNGSDEVPVNAKEVIEMMENAWLNEKFAPEILPHKIIVVECLLGQINYMENSLQNLSSMDFQKSIHQMEIDRLRFMVTSYLRLRIEKIETFVDAVLAQEHQREEKGEAPYLTNNELSFAKEFQKSVHEYFGDLLKYLPEKAQNSWKNNMVVPNLHSFVFAKSKVEVDGVLVDDGTDEEGIVDFRNGSQMIISYNSIANLVKDDEVVLI